MKSFLQFINEARSKNDLDANKQISELISSNASKLPSEPKDDEWWDEYGWAYFDDSESYVTDGYGLFINVQVPEDLAEKILKIAEKAASSLARKKLDREDTTDSDSTSAGYNTYYWEN